MRMTLLRAAQTIMCYLHAVYDVQFPTSDGGKFRAAIGEIDKIKKNTLPFRYNFCQWVTWNTEYRYQSDLLSMYSEH